MKPERKLSFRQQTNEEQQARVAETANTVENAKEFNSAEELLRYDAAQTPVPAAIAQRLAASTQVESANKNAGKPDPGPWWKRFLR